MTDSPIERYLDALFVALGAVDPRDARSLLSEAESHLRDSAAAAEQRGLSRLAAEQLAVDGFGDVRKIAAADRNRSTTHVAARLAVSGWLLGCIGAMAVGVSGLIAGLMRLLGASTAFIAGTRSTADLRPSDCARWLAGSPHAHSCAQAALADWTAEVIAYRTAIGVLGALGFAALRMMRRRSRRVGGWTPLPPVVVHTIATSMFGAAGLGLTVLGIDAVLGAGGHGAGFWLSAAPVALAAALVFGVRVLREVAPTT